MFARALPIISGVFLVFFILACNGRNHYPENPPTSSSIRELPDTLYVSTWSYSRPEYDSLPDSLVRLYGHQAHDIQNDTAEDLINNYSAPYFAYAAEPYYLGDSTWGKLIFFRPERNDYYSSQFYLINDEGTIKDVIELAYAFFDAGVDGDGRSLLINQGREKIIYSKLYWYHVGDGVVSLDTIVAYRIQQGRRYALPVSEEKRKELRQLFEQYQEERLKERRKELRQLNN